VRRGKARRGVAWGGVGWGKVGYLPSTAQTLKKHPHAPLQQPQRPRRARQKRRRRASAPRPRADSAKPGRCTWGTCCAAGEWGADAHVEGAGLACLCACACVYLCVRKMVAALTLCEAPEPPSREVTPSTAKCFALRPPTLRRGVHAGSPTASAPAAAGRARWTSCVQRWRRRW